MDDAVPTFLYHPTDVLMEHGIIAVRLAGVPADQFSHGDLVCAAPHDGSLRPWWGRAVGADPFGDVVIQPEDFLPPNPRKQNP